MAGAYWPASPARFKLFGIIHGHFGNDLESDAVVNDGKEKQHVNFGIAIVTPADKIAEVLEQFSEAEKFEAEDARNRKRITGWVHPWDTESRHKLKNRLRKSRLFRKKILIQSKMVLEDFSASSLISHSPAPD
jgi:hypothetical protein